MPRLYNYTKVDSLPAGAVTVKNYAVSINVSTSLIYHRIKRNVATYKIVVYCGINFVVF